MRLEKIILHGFKSFVEKTELKVLPGITAVVGPNGCGKSNIADAIRWALGEQSPKLLRGHKMEDVIFHGSASRKPVGLSDVSLVFVNDGTLSVPWSEVMVSRRLYRTGESEYLLNKTVCRLRDILDLFIGTGVNPKAYALMEQERLNQVLTARPIDRRLFIEEAAGISRYKQQRAETVGKLDATRQNLTRVRDVMDEVRRQLHSLERQAKKAQQYKTLAQERQSLGLTVLAANYAQLTRQEAEREHRLKGLRDEESLIRTRLAELSGVQANRRVEVQTNEHQLSDLRQSVQKVQGELERLIERREQLGLQIGDLEEEGVRLDQESVTLRLRKAGLIEELRQKRENLAQLEETHREREQAVRAINQRLEQIRTLLQSGRDQNERLRLDQARVAGQRVELIRSVGELEERATHLARQRVRLTEERSSARAELERIADQRSSLDTQGEMARHEIARLERELAQLEEALNRSESERQALQARVEALRVSLAGKRSSFEALERLHEEREGYGAGVRAIFNMKGERALPGVLGTVADLLDVPPELTAGIEAVLGDRLEWVVVREFGHAKAALSFLQERGSGSATFLPLETLPPANGNPSDTGEIRWAHSLVGCEFENLLHYLLGPVGVVEHLDQAEALWRRNGVTATYVTPQGEVLSPTGRLTGGRPAGSAQAEHSLLQRKHVLRVSREEVERLAAELESLQGEWLAAEHVVNDYRGQQPALRASLQIHEGIRLSAEKELEQLAREHDRAGRLLEGITTEEQLVVSEDTETHDQLSRLRQTLNEMERSEAALGEQMAEIRRSIEARQSEESECVSRLTEAQVEVASLGERSEALHRELEHLVSLEQELAERLQHGQARRQSLIDRQEELRVEQARADQRAVEISQERDRLEARERELGRRGEEFRWALQQVEESIRDAERQLTRMTNEIHEVELHITADRVRREEMEGEARRSFGINPDELLQAYDPAVSLESVRERLTQVEEKVASMGAVNLVADEEYRELEERLAFLKAQHDDLTGSIKDLEKALRGMTKTAQERFLQAFEAINKHFGEIFARLFEGGRAELMLTESEDGDALEAGVELMAQPRGKRLQAVSLLSGGEKALTGLALLFAIFYYRPSPFCVLDEVDAPLDDANIHRFLRVLAELAQHTQFLLITHNRKTMEAADVLYGITMEEPGLSRLVSVKLAP
ncbi:MAG TPA: chromosome segregation protein SMC [Methylomirabilota bacterium]|nr:chromosome segregation protein SMC [Methylomirabilota bacterium]